VWRRASNRQEQRSRDIWPQHCRAATHALSQRLLGQAGRSPVALEQRPQGEGLGCRHRSRSRSPTSLHLTRAISSPWLCQYSMALDQRPLIGAQQYRPLYRRLYQLLLFPAGLIEQTMDVIGHSTKKSS
jgi:hypothetical protein